MPFHQTSTSRDQPGGVRFGYLGESSRRFPGQERGVGPGRPGDVAKMLYRVHQPPGLKTIRYTAPITSTLNTPQPNPTLFSSC